MGQQHCIISLQGVSKMFDGVTVVNHVNLDITKGEFVTFLGPSGCGKTTTLRMIAGFETPDEGRILLNGEDLTKVPPYKRPINTVFQRYALFPYYDVYDNIAFGLKIKKIPQDIIDKKGRHKIKMRHLTKKEIDEKVARALRIVDLEELEDRNINTLSGGQQQRVAIARAIVNEPEILLLDEPLGALDLKMRQEMQLELKEMHKKLGITFIYVTHDQEEALTMSDTIVVMKAGEIQQIGTPMDIYNEPKNAYVANFIGESNIYNAMMAGPRLVRFLNHVFKCVDDFPVNEKVDVVVRPEDVILTPYKKEDNIDEKSLLKGVITTKIFKGIHFSYLVMSGKNEVEVQTTKNWNIGDEVIMDVEPDNIQIMEKDVTKNVYTDAFINHKHQLVIGEDVFDVDLTSLIKNSRLDENDFLVDLKGVKYDLAGANVIAKIPFSITITDGYDNGNVNGTVVSTIYKGDHYQIMVRTKEEEDYILEDPYTYNVDDKVSLLVKKEDIHLTLKGDISQYEVKE